MADHRDARQANERDLLDEMRKNRTLGAHHMTEEEMRKKARKMARGAAHESVAKRERD